ncbi:putative RecR [Streptomyces misionensis JCM 4497]
MGGRPQLHPSAPHPDEPGPDRLGDLPHPAGHRECRRRNAETVPPAVRGDQRDAEERRGQVRPHRGDLGRRLGRLERRQHRRHRPGRLPARQRPGHPHARVAGQHPGRHPADRPEPREPRDVRGHDLPADRPRRRAGRRRKRGRGRWRWWRYRRLYGGRHRGPGVGRPVQPQRLGERFRQLDRHRERTGAREGHRHLERDRELSQCPGAGRQAQRQRRQLGADHPEERLHHLADVQLYGELIPGP